MLVCEKCRYLLNFLLDFILNLDGSLKRLGGFYQSLIKSTVEKSILGANNFLLDYD